MFKKKKNNDRVDDFKGVNLTGETTAEDDSTAKVSLVGSDGEVVYSAKVKQPKQRKKMKRGPKAALILGIIIVVIVGGCFGLSKLPSKGTPTAVASVGNAEVMDLETVVTVKGTVEGAEYADVYSTANYKITEILVKEGDYVTKGQVLAKLDASDLSSSYGVSSIAYNDAKKAYNDAAALYAEGAISKSDYDAAKSAYETARLNLSALNISEKSTVTSPIDGTVTRVNCTVGRIAGDTNNKAAMFVIEDIDNLKMKVSISEYDISEIKVGQEVTISANVLGKETVKGTVSHISPTGELKADNSGEMVIPVTIDVDKGDTNLIAGVTAKAKILTARRENVMTVPTDAIFENPETGETSVFTVDETDMLHQVKVETGLEGDFNTEITKGDIKDGDRVLLSPSFENTDGQTIVVM